MMEGEKKCIRDISDTVKSFNLLTMEGSIMQREQTGQKLYLNESLPWMAPNDERHQATNTKHAEITSLWKIIPKEQKLIRVRLNLSKIPTPSQFNIVSDLIKVINFSSFLTRSEKYGRLSNWKSHSWPLCLCVFQK